MQDCQIELFPKAEAVYKQCSPGICPCWSSSPMTLVSSLVIISEQIQRAATCVPPVAEPPGFENKRTLQCMHSMREVTWSRCVMVPGPLPKRMSIYDQGQPVDPLEKPSNNFHS